MTSLEAKLKSLETTKASIESELNSHLARYPTLKAALDTAECEKQKVSGEGKARIDFALAKVSCRYNLVATTLEEW